MVTQPCAYLWESAPRSWGSDHYPILFTPESAASEPTPEFMQSLVASTSAKKSLNSLRTRKLTSSPQLCGVPTKQRYGERYLSAHHSRIWSCFGCGPAATSCRGTPWEASATGWSTGGKTCNVAGEQGSVSHRADGHCARSWTFAGIRAEPGLSFRPCCSLPPPAGVPCLRPPYPWASPRGPWRSCSPTSLPRPFKPRFQFLRLHRTLCQPPHTTAEWCSSAPRPARSVSCKPP